ncbi:hypothetical protein F6R98_03985 [Candidatus Methylospira mobilis]|uniref:TlpA family protein disulfide reductase n=1 Tax=Candidatus Methylospira mobilis TaxID=1808979 RepID=A0A5Q0BDH1_9GAMM|nr:hypothetical protein [Candidatus Methylospira mobilis]QFY41895.1 hypothetical protein F6R98_03985 [Candidatus Methylospira mobilis]WNV06775.1 hypothetical protein RP726_10320 [Candidatus Methylospira mobilis]
MKTPYLLFRLSLPAFFNRLNPLAGLLFVFMCLQYGQLSAEPAPYDENSWNRIEKSYAGKHHIVHFWGVTCGPCVDELKTWAKFTRQHPEIPLILVQVDEATPQQAEKLLQNSGMGRVENWSLAAYLSDAMRYEIDSTWVGELPYTRLTGADGKTRTLRGAADFTEVELWLGQGRISSVALQGQTGKK